MTLSQKCQYAIRAIYELARRRGQGPIKLGEIAEEQAIPPRFLELILRQLRQGRFVDSRRGVHGGYVLAVSPNDLSVGEVIRFIDGEMSPVPCLDVAGPAECALHGQCAFMKLWVRARDAVNQVYGETTFQDLLDEQSALDDPHVPDYCI